MSMQAAIALAVATLLGGVTAAAIAINVYSSDTSGMEQKIEASQQRVQQMQDKGIQNMRDRIGDDARPKSPSNFR